MAAVMHCVLALCALACLTAAAAANGRTAGGHAGGGRGRHGRNQRASSPERAAFEEWKEAHGISYDSAAEENVEFTQWLENDESIKAHNRAGVGWELGHNAYSSHTWGQFKKKMGIDMTERKLEREFPSIGVHKAGDFAGDSPAVLKARLEKVARQHAGSAVGSGRQWETVLSAQRGMSLSLGNANPNVPEERDWVAEGGVVEPVPNQGNCGSVRALPLRFGAATERALCPLAALPTCSHASRCLLRPRRWPTCHAASRAVLVLLRDWRHRRPALRHVG